MILTFEKYQEFSEAERMAHAASLALASSTGREIVAHEDDLLEQYDGELNLGDPSVTQFLKPNFDRDTSERSRSVSVIDKNLWLDATARQTQSTGLTLEPLHIAIIINGSGQWAENRGRPRLFGHHAGVKRIVEILRTCPALNVKYLTIAAFATQDWKRTQQEVAGLMSLFRRYIQREIGGLKKLGANVRFIGERENLDAKLVAVIDAIEEATKGNETVFLTISLNMGSGEEVGRASKRLAEEVSRGNIDPQSVDEYVLASLMDNYFLPKPNLVLKTLGASRVSKFLLWQESYSDYRHIDMLWPDVTAEIFEQAVNEAIRSSSQFSYQKS